MVPGGADGSPKTSFSAAKGRPRYDLPVLVVLLFEPNPPKPVLCCWLLLCPNPEKAIVAKFGEGPCRPSVPFTKVGVREVHNEGVET